MEIHVTAEGSTASTVRTALNRAQAGDTVVLGPGQYPLQYINNYDRAAEVFITHQPGAVVRQWTFTNAANLTLVDSVIRVTGAHAGIRIQDDTENITIRRATLDATDGQRGVAIQATAKGVPAGITIEHSDISGSYGDLIAIYGADLDGLRIAPRNITIARNTIHNPDVRTGTVDHIDGVQVSDVDGLVIEENRIYDTRFSFFGGPHQGIILSTVANQKIHNVRIRGNRIGPWRGTGIVIGGTGITDVRCYGNEVSQSYGTLRITNNALQVVDAYANAA